MEPAVQILAGSMLRLLVARLPTFCTKVGDQVPQWGPTSSAGGWKAGPQAACPWSGKTLRAAPLPGPPAMV